MKMWRGTESTTRSLSATTVALRGAFDMQDISPNQRPAERDARYFRFPFSSRSLMKTPARPESTTKKSAVYSPSRQTIAPGAKTRNSARSSFPSSARDLSRSPIGFEEASAKIAMERSICSSGDFAGPFAAGAAAAAGFAAAAAAAGAVGLAAAAAAGGGAGAAGFAAAGAAGAAAGFAGTVADGPETTLVFDRSSAAAGAFAPARAAARAAAISSGATRRVLPSARLAASPPAIAFSASLPCSLPPASTAAAAAGAGTFIVLGSASGAGGGAGGGAGIAATGGGGAGCAMIGGGAGGAGGGAGGGGGGGGAGLATTGGGAGGAGFGAGGGGAGATG